MKRRTFIKIGLGTTALAAVPFQACRGVEPEDRRPENMHLDFSACPHCNAQRFEHHKSYHCPRAAIPAGEEEFYKTIPPHLAPPPSRPCEARVAPLRVQWCPGLFLEQAGVAFFCYNL